MTLSGARAHFCASHRDDEGRLHGHSYVVWVWVEACSDVIWLQGLLAAFLDTFDHQILEHELARAEGIAELVGEHFTARRVVVERPVEGISAEWTAE